jgi:hypothetical protein
VVVVPALAPRQDANPPAGNEGSRCQHKAGHGRESDGFSRL